MPNEKKFAILLLIQLVITSCLTGNHSAAETLVVPVDTSTPLLETPQVVSSENICVEFPKSALGNLGLSGKLVVYKQQEKFLLNLTDDSYVSFAGEISPSGDKLATYEYGKTLVVVDLSNNVLTTFPWNPRWTEANETLFGSLADSDSLFYSWHDNDTITIPALPVGSMFILNALTNEAREIKFPYSSDVYGIGYVGDIRDYFVSYSPNLDKVVYASTQSHLVLRNNSIYNDGMWRTVTWVGFSWAFANPSWSPDSSVFAVVMEAEKNIQNLYQVSADFAVGEKQLTDLGEYFNHPFQIWISQVRWAPDGSKIAFVANVTQNEGGESFPHLLVLDVDTNILNDYCNPDPDNPYSSGGFSYSWSPDGEYIATDTMIADLGSRRAYKVPDVYIVDWVGEKKTK